MLNALENITVAHPQPCAVDLIAVLQFEARRYLELNALANITWLPTAFAKAGFEVRVVYPFATKHYREPADPGKDRRDRSLSTSSRGSRWPRSTGAGTPHDLPRVTAKNTFSAIDRQLTCVRCPPQCVEASCAEVLWSKRPTQLARTGSALADCPTSADRYAANSHRYPGDWKPICRSERRR